MIKSMKVTITFPQSDYTKELQLDPTPDMIITKDYYDAINQEDEDDRLLLLQFKLIDGCVYVECLYYIISYDPRMFVSDDASTINRIVDKLIKCRAYASFIDASSPDLQDYKYITWDETVNTIKKEFPEDMVKYMFDHEPVAEQMYIYNDRKVVDEQFQRHMLPHIGVMHEIESIKEISSKTGVAHGIQFYRPLAINYLIESVNIAYDATLLANALYDANFLISPLIIYLSINDIGRLIGHYSESNTFGTSLAGYAVLIDMTWLDMNLEFTRIISKLIYTHPEIVWIVGTSNDGAPADGYGERYDANKEKLINMLNHYDSGIVKVLSNNEKIRDEDAVKYVTAYGKRMLFDKQDIDEILAKIRHKKFKRFYDLTQFTQIEFFKAQAGSNTMIRDALDFDAKFINLKSGYDESTLSKISIIHDGSKRSNRNKSKCCDLQNDSGRTLTKKNIQAEIDNLVGLTDIKDVITKMVNQYAMQNYYTNAGIKCNELNRHMVFSGNPGTAKTTMARLIYKRLKAEKVLAHDAPFVEVGRSDLIGKFVGQTAPLVVKQFDRARGGILFIDEAYSLSDNYHGYGKEAIDTIVREMENRRDDVIVIFAGYKKEMQDFIKTNPGLSSRIGYNIDFPDYTPTELASITTKIVKDSGFRITPKTKDFIQDQIKSSKSFKIGNGRVARTLVESAIMNHSSAIMNDSEAPNKMGKNKLITLTEADFVDAFRSIDKNSNSTKTSTLGF